MQKPGFSHFAVSRGSFLRKVSPLRSETYRRNKRCYNPCHIQKLNISLMNHYKEKTRSVQLTRTKTPPHQPSNAKTKIKKQERTTRKNRQKTHGPTKNRHTVPAQFRFRSIKKAAGPTKKKTISPPTAKLNRQNAPHAQNPLFQRLRAAPARAKPPVNSVLDRQGRRKSAKRKKIVIYENIKPKENPIYNAEMLKKNKTQQTTFNDRKNIKTDINNEEKLAQKKTQQKMRKKRQATHKAYKKTKKNAQSTAKKDILRKTNRQAEGTPNL